MYLQDGLTYFSRYKQKNINKGPKGNKYKLPGIEITFRLKTLLLIIVFPFVVVANKIK